MNRLRSWCRGRDESGKSCSLRSNWRMESCCRMGGGQLLEELGMKILEEDEDGGEMKRRIGELLDGLKVRVL